MANRLYNRQPDFGLLLLLASLNRRLNICDPLFRKMYRLRDGHMISPHSLFVLISTWTSFRRLFFYESSHIYGAVHSDLEMDPVMALAFVNPPGSRTLPKQKGKFRVVNAKQ